MGLGSLFPFFSCIGGQNVEIILCMLHVWGLMKECRPSTLFLLRTFALLLCRQGHPHAQPGRSGHPFPKALFTTPQAKLTGRSWARSKYTTRMAADGGSGRELMPRFHCRTWEEGTVVRPHHPDPQMSPPCLPPVS